MNNYKIKVNNEAESREAQELFFELGCGWYISGSVVGYLNKPYIYKKGNFLSYGSNEEIFNTKEFKEITLQQLRDIVVLKRNKIEDATHECMGDKFLVQENRRYEWTFSGWATSGIAMSKLKPISEQKMASHNIEQQELKANPKLFLDPTQNYAEIEWDGSFMKGDKWIEVPSTANYLYKDNEHGNVVFTALEMGYRDSSIVWQRTQDEPFLTPESVVEREVNSKNVVQKVNEFSERMKKLEYQVGTMGSSASGGANLMLRNSAKSISIHGTIGSKLDLEPLEDALGVQIGGNHYKNMKIQPVEFALANNLDFCQGSAIKYILRHAEKGGKQDLEKAKHFIDLMIDHYYK